MKLKSIRLRNFRCFEDTGEIELKPLTVLVGANSSGKSSILKFFPLLQQSIKASIDGIFKWSSKDNDEVFVDFYSFENAVINNDKTKSINMDLVFLKNDGGTFAISETIDYDDDKNEIISFFSIQSEDENAKLKLVADFKKEELKFEETTNKLQKIKEQTGIFSKIEGNNLIPNFNNKKLSPWLKLVGQAKGELDNFAQFGNYAQSIYYIQPLRMDTIRSYSLAYNPRTDVLYSDASNIAYYLDQLSDSDKIELNQWFCDNGFDLIIDFERLSESREKGYLEIYIKTQRMQKSRNIVDMGFGFSQILPIIVLMWDSIKKVTKRGVGNSNQYSKIVVIEQPEVHLHPRYVGQFATIIAQTIKLCEEKQIPISFIVETHSYSFLNKIGTLILEEQLEKKNVVVYRFDMNESTGVSTINISDYDDDGYLENWPIGFFDED